MDYELSDAVNRGFRYFESFTNLERQAGTARTPMRLDRMRALLAAFGHPQRTFRSLHIAGSKGKGSTAAFLESVLRTYGYRVGLYTSPHVRDYRERIWIDGRPAEDALLRDVFTLIRAHVEHRYPPDPPADRTPESEQASVSKPDPGRPTTFELLTLLAFLVFREAGCDWAVVETGLGGRLDATNVLEPAACLITRIEREHVEYLGDRLEQIADEKAGIIKAGVPVFSAVQRPEVAETIARRAAERSAPLYTLESAASAVDTTLRRGGMRLRLTLAGFPELTTTLRLIGSVQAQNAALAAYCVFRQFPEIAPAQIAAGLAGAWLPARGELLDTEPPVMIDGAHTADSVAAVCAEFCSLFPGPRTLVFGAVRGKDYRTMAAALAPAFERIVVARPGSFKPSDLRELAAAFGALGAGVEVHPEAADAWRAASRYGYPVLVTGSFYLAAALHSVLDRIRR